MIRSRKLTVKTTKTVLDDYICNRCGESCRNKVGTTATGEPIYNYEGLLEHQICGGYGSKIGDMTMFSFSLCETCLLELFQTFKHEPTMIDPLTEEPLEEE